MVNKLSKQEILNKKRNLINKLNKLDNLRQNIQKSLYDIQKQCPHEWSFCSCYEDSGFVCSLCDKSSNKME